MIAPESQEDLFFGDLLKEFRRRKNLTQQQLAKQIGASREAVSLWERGQFKPETITMLHELARVLVLDNDEKRLLFEAHVGTASVLPLHRLPEHNPFFTGREDILKLLHLHLTAGKQVALIQTQAISGLGGIGKTQVAIEYAYRFREHYHDILWAPADSRETLMASYLMLAKYLRLREREEREQHKVIEAMKRWLREHKGWLLILDNIEDLGLIREFVPAPRQGAVVLTTRRAETQPVAQALVLDTLPEKEGMLFLLKRAVVLSLEASLEKTFLPDREAAKAIVHAVRGLPLALDQAGAYVAETKCSLSDYLALFKREQKALLERRGTVPSDHPQSVTTTFTLAFEQVQQKNKTASELLHLCAFLAPDAIPLELITQGAVHLGTILEVVVTDVLSLNQALETLQVYSLIRRHGVNHTFSIHRLVQAVLQDTMGEAERRIWAERAAFAANAAFPQVEHDTWPQCERLLTQALIATQLIEQYQIIGEEAGRLLHETAIYLRDHARYTEAEPLFQRALQIREQQLGSEHLAVAASLHSLALLYYERDKYTQAEPLFQRALQIREQQLGHEHPDVAFPLTGLANLYRQQGKYEQAELLFQRALHIREQTLGHEHPDVAFPLTGLANLYRQQGKYEQAELLYQRALHIREQVLGLDHVDVAYPLDRLARLYKDQGKYGQAELLYQRALHIREQALGSGHAYVASSLVGLANVYRLQGKYEQAELLYQRALHIREEILGTEHPDTASILQNLGLLYGLQGKYTEAEPLAQRALHIHQQQLGHEHLTVAYSLHTLAELYRFQGKYAESEPLYQRVLEIREQQLGHEHPLVAYSLHALAELYRFQGKYAEAEPLYQRVLGIREQQLGHEHLTIAYPLNGLAILYYQQRKYAEAELLFRRALQIHEQALEPQRPAVAETMQGFAQLREAQGNSEEAKAWYARALTVRGQTLGAYHPKTTETRKRLVALLRTMALHEQAAQLEAVQTEQRMSEEEQKAHPEE